MSSPGGGGDWNLGTYTVIREPHNEHATLISKPSPLIPQSETLTPEP